MCELHEVEQQKIHNKSKGQLWKVLYKLYDQMYV